MDYMVLYKKLCGTEMIGRLSDSMQSKVLVCVSIIVSEHMRIIVRMRSHTHIIMFLLLQVQTPPYDKCE